MPPRQLGYATIVILKALSAGAQYGLDVMSRTNLPSGTVYPTFSRLEKRGFVKGIWESRAIAEREGRPRRRYYELTSAGAAALRTALGEMRALTTRPVARPQESDR